jgi:hypothetical protein
MRHPRAGLALLAALFTAPAAADDDPVRQRERTQIWKRFWEEQKPFFTWPAGFTAAQRQALTPLVFGADLPDGRGLREKFADAYRSEYADLARAAAPIQFRDSWEKALLPVEAWKGLPSSEDVWLALEDLWLQREVLDCLRRVNAEAGRFELVDKDGKADGVQRSFRGRVWRLDLTLARKEGKQRIEAKLTNLSPRVQPLGADYRLRFKVWTSDDLRAEPFVFEAARLPVAAGATVTVASAPDHELPANLRATGFYRVEQLLDLGTVPIKCVAHLPPGKLSERDHRQGELKMAAFSAKAAGEKAEPLTANGRERRRYVEVNGQFRRRPFAVSVVVDQEAMPELLVEFAKSKLLCQITQAHWARLHEGLAEDAKPVLPPMGPRPLGPPGPLTGPMGPTPGPAAPDDARGKVAPDNLVVMSIYGIMALAEPFVAARPVNAIEGPHASKLGWLRLHEVVNASLPVPGEGGNLTGDRERLWNTDEGRRATERYFERLRKGINPEAGFRDDDLRQHLPTVEIEAVHSRFADLEPFFKKAKQFGKKFVGGDDDVFHGMEKSERDPLMKEEPDYPKGSAWVVEVRGTTYFDRDPGPRELLRRTLLEYLRKNATAAKPPAGKVSHAFLYNVWKDENPRPATYHFIDNSLIDELVTDDGGQKNTWAPRPPIGQQGRTFPVALPPKAPGDGPKAKAKPRYEFVLVFVWREPPAIVADDEPAALRPKPPAPFFEPVAPPDDRRVNPAVLPVTEMQVDFLHAKVRAYDILNSPDGPRLGILGNNEAKDDPPVKGKRFDRLGEKRKPPALKDGPEQFGPREGVTYVPLTEAAWENKRLAWTIYPQRFIVIQAAIPYRAQVEEVRRALHLATAPDVFRTPDAAPHFRGVVVERQIRNDAGRVEVPWRTLDVDANHRATIFHRKYGDMEEEPKLRGVMLPEDYELVMPLPVLIGGKYPEVRLRSVLDAARKLQGNVPAKRPNPIAPGPDGPLPEHVLVRIIDNDVEPGRRYQYRLKVRMQNPNWVGAKDEKGKFEKGEKLDLVARPADALVEIIEGPFVEMKDTIATPREDFLYTLDPPEPRGRPLLRPGQALMQVQSWLPVVTVGKFKEPVGDWVVADVVARPGRYLGGEQLVSLPPWSSELNRYVLHEAPAEKGPRKGPRFGVVIDPTRGARRLVVAVRGGPQEWRSESGRRLAEETASEVLVLNVAGELRVHASHADRTDPARVERERRWEEWVRQTEKDAMPPRLPMNPFERP